MRSVILYRKCDFSDEELKAAQGAGFYCTDMRPNIQKDDVIVGRFSLWPFYADQEREFKLVGAKLINTHAQHSYITDLMNWVEDLKELTPRTWANLHEIPDDGTQFVLKGETHSKKSQWSTHMFAKNKAAAIQVHSRLSEDGLIGSERIYTREFVPLVEYGKSISGCPISKEFRFFVLHGEVLCGGYYWSIVDDTEITKPSVNEVPKEFLDEVLKRVAHRVPAFAVDVAQTKDDRWVVIELNDLQFSGLSDNDPTLFYSRLKTVMNKHYPEARPTHIVDPFDSAGQTGDLGTDIANTPDLELYEMTDSGVLHDMFPKVK